MSILIKGMEMPQEGTFNIVHIYSDGRVAIPFWGKGMQVVQGIEAAPVPKHSRLIDADVLFDRMEFEIKHFVPTDEFSRGVLSGYRSAARAARYASTIIPASEEGET